MMKNTERNWNLAQAIESNFEQISFEEWLIAVENSLKGKEFSSLTTYTDENIPIKPLYTKADLPYAEIPLSMRGIYKPNGIKPRKWKIAQTVQGKTVHELSEKIQNSLINGQDTLSFSLINELSVNNFDQLFEGININQFPFAIKGDVRTIPFTWMLAEWIKKNNIHREQIRGFIGFDPLNFFIDQAQNKNQFESLYQHWIETIQYAHRAFPNLQTIYIDGTIYEKQGANITQQLALTFSSLVFHIEQLRQKGFSLEEIFSKIVIGFAIGSDFFQEIAKFRAAKYLWYVICRVYNLSESFRKLTIYAETTVLNKTITDPYVNIIRATGESLAAVISQVDYLNIVNFDFLLDHNHELGERIARNTHHLLREEARLGTVIDAGGGSWYIESLTKQMIEKAWELFLFIDEQDGIVKLIENGYFDQQIRPLKEKRIKDVHTGRTKLVGTNVYRDLKEKTFPAVQNKWIEVIGLQIHSLEELRVRIKNGARLEDFVICKECLSDWHNMRLSEKLDSLLTHSQLLEKKYGKKLAIGIIGLQQLKNNKSDRDFISQFFAIAAIESVQSNDCYTCEDIISFIEHTNLSFYCLCGASDERFVQNAVSEMKEKFPDIELMAVKPENRNILQYYHDQNILIIDEAIDRYEVLKTLLEHMEVKYDEARL